MLSEFLAITQFVFGIGAGAEECATGSGLGSNVWERAKQPSIGKYCELLSAGASLLAAGNSRLTEVLSLAESAQKCLPERVAPLVLEGRTLDRLGRFAEAYSAFHQALVRDPFSVEDAPALYAYARAAGRSGHLRESRAAFEKLLPRTDGLSSEVRALAYLEAGLSALRDGPTQLELAIEVLGQGRREGQGNSSEANSLFFALALDRAGQTELAQLVLGETRSDAFGVLSDSAVKDAIRTSPQEEAALIAFLKRRSPMKAESVMRPMRTQLARRAAMPGSK